MGQERRGDPRPGFGRGLRRRPATKVSWSAVWRESRELLWARRGRLLTGLGLLLVGRLGGLVLPASTKVIIDEVIGRHRAELLPWIALAAAVGLLLQTATSLALTLILGVAAQRSINELRLKVQRHVARLPIGYFDDHKSGELVARIMNDAEGIRSLVGSGFVQLVGGGLSALLALVVLFWLNWRLTSITLVMLVAFAAVMGVGLARLRPLFRQRSELLAELTGRLAESLAGMRVVKAYTAERREARIFTRGLHRLLRNIVRSMVGISGVTSLSSLLFGLTGLGMGVLGAREVLAGRMSLGDLFMFVVFTGLLVTPLVQMTSIGTQVTEAFAGLDRIREILGEPTEDAGDGDRLALPELRGEVVFEDVTFEYKSGVPVLREVTFVAPAGTTTALVGPSGAGKSTVISLVLAFRRPQSGRVTVDGHDLERVRLAEYRRHLAVVLQDDFLFDGTIAENIAYGHPPAGREQILEAGRLAHCDEFVKPLEKGYDTVIGERGVKLSGGQRQRVTIARAILADPRILILDEATSSLDSESEELIQEGLAVLQRGRTSFVIAHRLSTIRNADQILVLEGGRIVERGDHRELLAAGGLYRRLYEKQHRLEQNRFINPGEELELEPGVRRVCAAADPAILAPASRGTRSDPAL